MALFKDSTSYGANGFAHIITDEIISNEIKSLTTANIEPHNSILEKLLEQIEAVNFHDLIAKHNVDVIKEKHFVVLVIEELLSLVKFYNFGLCTKHDFVYLFNGAYWKPIDKDEFRSFLGKVAVKLGIIEIEAKHFSFRDGLYKQFIALADPPKTNGTETVLINLQNGTLEINNSEINLRDFDPDDFLTYQLPFPFERKAQCPFFTNYLNQVLPDKSLQYVLAEFIGYCFTRGLKLEKSLFLHGGGANGKSVFFDIVCAIFGRENITNFSLANLSEEHNRALLTNKLLNYSSELGAKKMIDSELFKNLVSGEPVQCRLKYGNSFFAYRYAKLMFNCNELPRDIEHTNAFFRRFLIIPFLVTIDESQQDKELATKIICNELSGVFNWILKGLQRLLENKRFTESEAVIKAVQEFREESDTVSKYWSENGYQKVNQNYDATALKVIYAEYKEYCSDYGFHAVSAQTLSARLRAKGIECKRTALGILVYASKQ